MQRGEHARSAECQLRFLCGGRVFCGFFRIFTLHPHVCQMFIGQRYEMAGITVPTIILNQPVQGTQKDRSPLLFKGLGLSFRLILVGTILAPVALVAVL